MSTYPTAPAAAGQNAAVAGPVDKPGTLTAAVIVAVLAGLASIGNAVVILAGGVDLAKELIVGELGGSADDVDSGGAFLQALATEAQETLQARAYIALGAGVLMTLFGLLMRKAATWSRVMVTISAVLVMLAVIMIVGDVANGLMTALGTVAFVAAIGGIVLAWLPANGRYAKALKQRA